MPSEENYYTHLKPLHHDTPIEKPVPALFELMMTYPEIQPKGVKSPISGKVQEYINQLGVTILIFIGFFILMNWGAISQNVVWEYQKVFQRADVVNPLYKFVEEKNTKDAPQEPLPLAKTAADASRQIPLLSMTIAPPDTRLIIPRINRNVPVINVSSESIVKKDWDKLEADMQAALQYGVIHYPGTARPGQQGNVVITGHSSYFPWDPGRFKDVFAVLHDLQEGDKILLYSNQKQYVYEVTSMKKIWPSELDVLKPTTENKLTLITCTPVGTNLKRLVIEAKLIRVQS